MGKSKDVGQAGLIGARYGKLLGDIRTLIDEGKRRVQEVAGQEIVTMYWHIGQRITKEHLTENAGYQEAVLRDLSDELQVDISTLRRSVAFYRAYPQLPANPALRWSHYKALIPVADLKQRQWYENLVTQTNMPHQQLSKSIQNAAFQAQTAAKKTSGKTKAVATALTRPKDAAYLYRGIVDRVIDGDSVPRKAAYEMRDGPSESTCRSRLQSALSGNGQNLLS